MLFLRISNAIALKSLLPDSSCRLATAGQEDAWDRDAQTGGCHGQDLRAAAITEEGRERVAHPINTGERCRSDEVQGREAEEWLKGRVRNECGE